MPEKLVDAAAKTAKAAERSMEGLVRKAWTIMDAASEKRPPSKYLTGRATRSIQGRATDG